MTTGTIRELAARCGRSVKVLQYHKRSGHLEIVCSHRPVLVDFERSVERLANLPPPRHGAGGARIRGAGGEGTGIPRKPREAKDELLERLARRDEIIAQRLIDAEDLGARRSLWYHVPLDWQPAIVRTFRELVKQQVSSDAFKRASLVAQMELICR